MESEPGSRSTPTNAHKPANPTQEELELETSERAAKEEAEILTPTVLEDSDSSSEFDSEADESEAEEEYSGRRPFIPPGRERENDNNVQLPTVAAKDKTIEKEDEQEEPLPKLNPPAQEDEKIINERNLRENLKQIPQPAPTENSAKQNVEKFAVISAPVAAQNESQQAKAGQQKNQNQNQNCESKKPKEAAAVKNNVNDHHDNVKKKDDMPSVAGKPFKNDTHSNNSNNTNTSSTKSQKSINSNGKNSNNSTNSSKGEKSLTSAVHTQEITNTNTNGFTHQNLAKISPSLKNSNNSINSLNSVTETGSVLMGSRSKGKSINYFFSENKIDSKTGLLRPTESVTEAMKNMSKLPSSQKFDNFNRGKSNSKFQFAGPKSGGQREKGRSIEVIHNHIVTKMTYPKTRWSCAFESLTIKDCLYLIFPQNLMHSRNVLTTLKFSSSTSFKNVLQVLRCCPNLIRLGFSNISLVHKRVVGPTESDLDRRLAGEDYPIELPYLRELQFIEWLSGLTRSEYWLLDFFTRAVTFGRLESLTFHGSENFMPEKAVRVVQRRLLEYNWTGANNNNSKMGVNSSTTGINGNGLNSQKSTSPPSTSSINLSTVWKFLQRNKTIEWLSIGGVGFYLIDPESLNSGNFGANFNVKSSNANINTQANLSSSTCCQLTSLRLTLEAPGIEHLLRGQRRLMSLSCSGFLSTFSIDLSSMVTDCIINNCTTLNTIRIFPCIIINNNNNNSNNSSSINVVAGNEEEDEEEQEKERVIAKAKAAEERRELYRINCECFQKCSRLQSLFLNVTTAGTKLTTRMSCGRIRNLHLLPTSLVEIEIYNEEFSPGDLDILGAKLAKFVQLQTLVLSSNSIDLYTVPLTWVQNLSTIRPFKSADFFGGKLKDEGAVKEWIESRRKNSKNPLDVTMTVCTDCVCFAFMREPVMSGPAQQCKR